MPSGFLCNTWKRVGVEVGGASSSSDLYSQAQAFEPPTPTPPRSLSLTTKSPGPHRASETVLGTGQTSSVFPLSHCTILPRSGRSLKSTCFSHTYIKILKPGWPTFNHITRSLGHSPHSYCSGNIHPTPEFPVSSHLQDAPRTVLFCTLYLFQIDKSQN